MKRPLVYPRSTADDIELQKLVEFYNETLGFCPNSIKTMHIRPRVAKAFIEMNKAVMENHGRLTSVLKRFIAYISSLSAGCRYCQAHSIRAAERYGASQLQLENIWDYKVHSSFSEAERAALDFAMVCSVVPNGVTDEVADNLRKYWDEHVISIAGSHRGADTAVSFLTADSPNVLDVKPQYFICMPLSRDKADAEYMAKRQAAQ